LQKPEKQEFAGTSPPILTLKVTRLPTGYTIIDIGIPEGGFSKGNNINNSGRVCRTSGTGQVNMHVFIWENGKMTDRRTLGGVRSKSQGLNNLGHVVGESYNLSQINQGVICRNGYITMLVTFQGNRIFTQDIPEYFL
jgi:probable HAF family extracellular repeat protein